MLRTRVQRRTGSTGVTLTVTHGLGTTLDFWNVVAVSNRSLGRTHVIPASVGANVIAINNPIQTTVTVDVFCWVFQGRLY